MNSTWEALYEALDFHNGALLPAIDEPSSDIDLVDWLDKGEWLAAAKRAGADKVFFVKNNPIAIFAECGSGDLDKIRAFNHAGCLGRPRLLFLVSPGEISVLDLAQKPISLSVDSCPDRHFVPPRMGSYPPFYGNEPWGRTVICRTPLGRQGQLDGSGLNKEYYKPESKEVNPEDPS